jgi:hypothetical protein
MVNGAIAHELAEVRRLCDRAYALVDSERACAEKQPIRARQQFYEICRELNIECCVTERRAIENYIPQRALDQKWGAGRFTELGPYGTPTEDGKFWGKGESWKAAAVMTKDELDKTDIGKLLDLL